MAEKDFENDDPFEFVAVRFPADPGVDSDEVMARCFIEEYRAVWRSPARIRTALPLALFRRHPRDPGRPGAGVRAKNHR